MLTGRIHHSVLLAQQHLHHSPGSCCFVPSRTRRRQDRLQRFGILAVDLVLLLQVLVMLQLLQWSLIRYSFDYFPIQNHRHQGQMQRFGTLVVDLVQLQVVLLAELLVLVQVLQLAPAPALVLQLVLVVGLARLLVQEPVRAQVRV